MVQTFRLAPTASVMVRKLGQKCWYNIRARTSIGKVGAVWPFPTMPIFVGTAFGKASWQADLLSDIHATHDVNTQQRETPAPQMFNVERGCSERALRNLRGSHNLFASACSPATLDLGGTGVRYQRHLGHTTVGGDVANLCPSAIQTRIAWSPSQCCPVNKTHGYGESQLFVFQKV